MSALTDTEVKRMPKYYHNKQDFKIIPKEEVDIMIRDEPIRDQALICIVWITGARISEVLDLDRANVKRNHEENTITFRIRTLKRKFTPYRDITLSVETPYIKEVVLPYLKHISSDKIFNIKKRMAQKIMQRINEKTGFWYTFHEFRHSRITFFCRNHRATTAEIMAWTGWASSKALGTYLIRSAPERFKDLIK